MKLRVRNFGPIRKADVELKPLTVFVGPSNTGKSYLAILLYSIAKTLGDEDGRTSFFFRSALRGLFRRQEKVHADDDSPDEIAGKSLSLYRDAVARSWQEEAVHCFGEEWQHIAPKNNGSGCSIEIGSQSNDAVLRLTAPGEGKLPSAGPLLSRVKKLLSVAAGKDGEESRAIYFFDFPRRIASHAAEAFDFLPKQIATRRWAHPRIRGAVSGSVHYLPAVRGGVMQSHRTLVSALIKGASKIGITGASIIPFTGVLGDFLNKLINIRDARVFSDRRSPAALSQRPGAIENKVMDGEIQMNMSETEYPDFRYLFVDKNNKQRDIPLMSASSSISELAPVVLFMRHYLSPGDIFIVEEPEAHLHPAAQRKMAGLLAGLVKAGVYVVITTHSDVILEQLSNFIHADGVPDAKVLNKKSAGRTINENDAAAYSFVKKKSGTVVNKIPFDGDTGMLTEDHLDASSDLYNEAVDIFNRKQREGGKNGD